MNKKGRGEIAGIGALAVIIIIAIFLFSSIDKVEANHLGVQVKLGNVVGVQHAGIQWTGPLVHVHQYDLRIRKATIDLTEDYSAADKKGQSIYAQIDVNYRLKATEDAVKSLWTNVGKDNVVADRLNIHPLIAEGFKQATVKYSALEILEKRGEVKELAKENIKNNFPSEYFQIVDIVISNIDFGDDFKRALEEKQTAIQLAEKAKNELEMVKFEQQQEIEKYKAEAEKLRLQRQEISELLVQQQMIAKWDGRLPDQLIIQEGSSGLFLQLAKGDAARSSMYYENPTGGGESVS